MVLSLKNEYDEYSIEMLLDIIDDNLLENIEMHDYILKRIFKDDDKESLIKLLDKNISVFPYLNNQEIDSILLLYINYLSKLPLNNLIKICRNTVIGNVIFICSLIKNNPIINYYNIDVINYIEQLDFLNEDTMLYYISDKFTFYLNIDDRIKDKKININNAIQFFENMFFIDRINLNINFIKSMILLYSMSDIKKHLMKKDVLSTLLNNEFDVFIKILSMNSQFDIKNEEDFKNIFLKIYYFLINKKIPIYYEYEKIEINNNIINNNAFYMLYKDKYDREYLLAPYLQIDAYNVNKIYDVDTETYVSPISIYREIKISEIDTFNNILKIEKVDEDHIKKIETLSEDEIEKKLDAILYEYNKTTHSPTEKVDIWTSKLAVFNKLDIRTSGFIIKGKSYKKIMLNDIAVNLIKAVHVPIDILILVYTGILDDTAKEYFIKEAMSNKILYSFIDRYDLARIFIAYDVY